MAEVTPSWSSLQDPQRAQSHASPSNAATSPDATSSTGPQSDSQQLRSRKPKQKRNKPTLSCKECVEHKTKCDRGRPTCLACVKRSTPCQYTHIADILAASDSTGPKAKRASISGGAEDRSSASKLSIANITHPPSGYSNSPSSVPSTSTPLQSQSTNGTRDLSTPKQGNESSAGMASLLSMETAPLSVFGMGGEHPFANYWTCKGGLAEVVN